MSIIFGIIGLVIISIAVWIKNERKQDFLFAAGGVSLLIYSISIKNLVFSILQVVFILSSLIELFRLRKHKSAARFSRRRGGNSFPPNPLSFPPRRSEMRSGIFQKIGSHLVVNILHRSCTTGQA
ncbi:YgjV family protein [Candidatus Uhrbacteria bacterium]|nr:YgjV family protein [Candidatus Uhrbacteria bacterium]